MAVVEKKGGNGKVLIDLENGTATKTLRSWRRKESVDRYRIELHALQEIQQLGLPSIVEVLSVDENQMTVVMKAYDGELSDLFVQTRNNPQLCSQLLIPVIQSLKALSELDKPIFHRDLKPANILYTTDANATSLFLSDFGCCYFTQESDRQTPDFRAVGAQSFRAPEYDYGRVEEVTSKGDIYSIGKILWAMLNGVKNEVFPYTLWFPKEYNLLNRFPNSSELILANLIIAKCVSINPDERPTYDELIELMNKITTPPVEQDAEKQLRVKLFSAKREFELVEIREMNANMLNLVYGDLMILLNTLCDNYPDLHLLSHLKSAYQRKYEAKNMHISHKIQNDVASYIFDASYDNIYLAINYHPTYSKRDGSSDDKYASISLDYRISSTNEHDELRIEYRNKTLHIIYQNESAPYEINTLTMFFEHMVDMYIAAFDSV